MAGSSPGESVDDCRFHVGWYRQELSQTEAEVPDPVPFQERGWVGERTGASTVSSTSTEVARTSAAIQSR